MFAMNHSDSGKKRSDWKNFSFRDRFGGGRRTLTQGSCCYKFGLGVMDTYTGVKFYPKNFTLVPLYPRMTYTHPGLCS